MRRLLLVIGILLSSVATQAADREIPQQAREALDGAVEKVDRWVENAQELEGQLKQVKATVEKAQKTQSQLTQAIAKRDIKQLQAAIKEWNPEWAGYVGDIDQARTLMGQLGLNYEAKSMEEALFHIAGKGRDLNGRVLEAWSSSGLGAHVNEALAGNGALGKAIGAAQKIKAVWTNVKDVKEQYDTILNDFERVFNPNSQSAYAGLEAIQNILNEFKDKAPPPVDAILGGYAEVVGGFITALQQLEQQINTNTRQMNLMRSFDSTKDGVLDELKSKFPEENEFELWEIKTPAYLEGRFFTSSATGRYYLYHDGTMHQFRGSLEDIKTLARWTSLVYGKSDPHRIAARLPNFKARMEEINRRLTPLYYAFRGRLPLLLDYIKYYEGFSNDNDEENRQKIVKYKSMNFDTFTAFYVFSPTDRTEMEYYGELFADHALVDVTVSGTGEGFVLGKAVIWIAPSSSMIKRTLTLVDGKFRGIVMAHNSSNTYVIGGTHAGAEARQDTVTVTSRPYRIVHSFAFTMQPEEEQGDDDGEDGDDDGGGVDPNALDDDNEGGDPPADPNSGTDEDPNSVTGVEGDTGDKTTDGEKDPLTDKDVENMVEDADKDTQSDPNSNETDETYGDLPPTDSELFDDFIMAVILGNHEEALEILEQIAGGDRDDLEEILDRLGDEAQTAQDFDKNTDPLDEPDDGPTPDSDDDYVESLGEDPNHLDDPIDPQDNPDEPDDGDLVPPDQDPVDPNDPFYGQRQAANNMINNTLNGQRQAVDNEYTSAQQDIKDTPIPTRGGMEPLDAGGAQTVTITVWDHGAEDGDIVRISLGGRTILDALRLTNAPQSFTVNLAGDFTSVCVIALNEGTSPPNTASFAIEANGRNIKTTKWDLNEYDMGSTVIRKGGQ